MENLIVGARPRALIKYSPCIGISFPSLVVKG